MVCDTLTIDNFGQPVHIGTGELNAQDAYDCLRAIPFDAGKGVTFVQEARKHLEWQSNIDSLRDPPSPAATAFGHVDLLQGLSDIEQKAQAKGYASQVDFDTAIRTLLSSANDGHLGIAGLCTDSIFSFRFDTILVSVANSSTSAPGVYEYDSLGSGNDSDTAISPISTIDGRPAAEFLSEYASLITLRDADARYNALFASAARHGGVQTLRGMFRSLNTLWTGYPVLNYTYANGTESSWHTAAFLNSNPSRWNYTTGDELFDAFCAPAIKPSSTSNETTSSNSTSPEEPSTAPTQTAFSEAYPKPVVRDPFNTLAGFYLPAPYDDTAVLFIPDFHTDGEDVYTGLALPDDEPANFGKAAAEFISRAKSDKKMRLVIDLTGNGGGTSLQGFNLFKLFFPTTPIYNGNRYRNHDFSRLLMKSLDTYGEDYTDEFTYPLARHFAWQGQVSPTQTALDWTSYRNFTGGETSNLTALTSFQNFTANSNPALPVQGYSNATTTFTSAPFAPEDILIVTDGYCASTCSIFVDLMTSQGGVNKTLVFGGRPPSSSRESNESIKPMQLVGGTRGTEQYDWATLADVAGGALDYAQERLNASKPTLSEEEIARFKELMPLPPSEFPLQFQSGSVNLRNGYDKGSDVPLEFESLEAKCRLYYTKENILEPATTWRDAVDAVWGGKSCAAVGGGGVDGDRSQSQSSQDETQSNRASAMTRGGPGVGAAVLFTAASIAAVATVPGW
ncbi:uncharacterized protein HMPREF1541_10565 [Cyphellophora europaea CBS 101466]|uniref:Uncharacterized protein n=1 Tax=Cyphellophora europaea (strain CBS 101466) TaxID=1220924 RepID=W2S6Z2_CYPE1|nr:uncharacterized protein HMPREF1541_10565 [Cyphellophora europaea CBS 101466]ETN44385.1 hypothetical protein HMPREF1541_10565 [Cyphellophora europaea CBS 101466]